MKISIKREQSQTGLNFAEREKFGLKVKKLFQWAMAAALICGASVFTACSSDDDKSSGSDTGTQGIAMIVKNGNIDYFRQIETSFRSVCKEKGLEAYYYSTTSETGYQEQVAAVAQLRKLGGQALKGIIFVPSFGPNGESAEAEVAALAKELSIPVIILDSPVTTSSPLASYPYFGTDNTAAGKAMAEQVTADKVAVFAMKGSPAIERAEAFQTLKPNADVYQVGDKATSEIRSALDKYEDFVFFNGNDLVNDIRILKSAGKNVYTFDVYGEFLDELIAGSSFFKGVMAQNTFGMARKAVEAVVANTKQGEMVPTFYITADNLDDANVKPFLEFYEKPARNDRMKFVQHTRQNLKTVAENMNFSSWEGINHLNNDFNTNVLNNPAFDKTISTLFSQTIQQSIKPVEKGSELAQMGYQKYAVIDFTAFNYRFTQNTEKDVFDVEPAEDFQLIFKRTQPQPQDGMGPEGDERPESPEGDPHANEYESLLLKASGSPVNLLASRMSTEQLAVIIRIPTAFEFALGTLMDDGTIKARLTGTFNNEFASRGTSSFADLRTDAWNISGTLQSSVDIPEGEGPQGGEAPQGGEGQQGPGVPGGGPKNDATTLTFAIGQDPATHEAGVQLGFIHNNVNILNVHGVMKNLDGQTDYSQHTSATSIAEAFAAAMAGNSLEEGTITLLNDLTTTLKISDCAKVIQLQNQMASARRSYADMATIEQYTQQLNQLVSGTMTCQGLGQTIPMKMQTIKFGVDYWAVPALNFADADGYVPLTEMLDQESMQYMINIIDHAADPMKQSIVTVRQLMQYLQTMMGTIKGKQG